jgi:CheY-like chemotaxis protein
MMSVLYVDDDPGLLEIGKIFLERGGQFAVETVTSAPAALTLLDTKEYDAIISDYMMPGDGRHPVFGNRKKVRKDHPFHYTDRARM